MFDRAIIDTDNFMDLPVSGKALYFLLGMEADDEGFVSPKRVMRIHGGNDDDLKVLIIKKLVIPFRSGVVVITDWHTNNYLDSRRVKPTRYQTEKSQLTLIGVGGNSNFTNDKRYVLSSGLASAQPEENRIEENKLVANATEAFSFEKELEKLKENSRKDMKIIALYWKKKGYKFENKEQFSRGIKRELKAAQMLLGYSGEQILTAIDYCEEHYQKIPWTLETCYKRIADLVNK